MAWIQIDDHFDEHPKLQQVGPLAWGVWLAGLAYCNRNLTDGFIPWTKARSLASFDVVEDDGKLWGLSRSSGMVGEDIDAEWVIGLLIDAGLWEEVDNGRGRVDGYQVHDYKDWQRSKAEILELRDKRVEAGRAGGLAKAVAFAKQEPKQNASKTVAKSYPQPQPQPNVAVSNKTATAAPLPPNGSPPSLYAKTLNGALPTLESMFQRIDQGFTPGWLAKELADAEAVVGSLSKEQLGRGLDIAVKQIERQMAAKAVRNPRPFAHRLIVDYLTEQREGSHAT